MMHLPEHFPVPRPKEGRFTYFETTSRIGRNQLLVTLARRGAWVNMRGPHLYEMRVPIDLEYRPFHEALHASICVKSTFTVIPMHLRGNLLS